MAANWLSIRVELLSGAPSGELWPPSGRDLAVGPRHTFRDLAAAIDDAVDCAGSRETWQDRQDFAAGLRPGPLRDRLLAALEGRGAFRRFSAVLDDEPQILAEWRAFGAERERGRARALLMANGYTPAPCR